MAEMRLVTLLAEKVRDRTMAYVAHHPDFAEVVRRRPHDVTLKLDLHAEQTLDDAILEEGISARVISEELGERVVPAGSRPEYTLLLDPVDGSKNVAAGIPYYCTSLGLSRKTAGATFADLDAAAVASACCGTFSAARGRGAYVDGKRICPIRREVKPIYAIYSYGAGAMPEGLIAMEEADECVVRTMGSVALDICLVARGTFDALVDTRFKVSGYDFMAAGLILREAGGQIRRTDGLNIDLLPLDASGGSIIATMDPGLMDRLLTVINLEKK